MAGLGRDVILATPELWPNNQGRRVLKGTGQLVTEIKSSYSVFVFSFALMCVFKENPPTAKKPRRRQHRFFGTRGPAAWLSLPAEAGKTRGACCFLETARKQHVNVWVQRQVGNWSTCAFISTLPTAKSEPQTLLQSPQSHNSCWEKWENQAFVSGFRRFDDNLC